MLDIEQDARRYDYIRRHVNAAIKDHPNMAVIGIAPPAKKYWFDSPRDIDTAIDELIEQENK